MYFGVLAVNLDALSLDLPKQFPNSKLKDTPRICSKSDLIIALTLNLYKFAKLPAELGLKYWAMLVKSLALWKF